MNTWVIEFQPKNALDFIPAFSSLKGLTNESVG